jgi:hypothetical protein
MGYCLTGFFDVRWSVWHQYDQFSGRIWILVVLVLMYLHLLLLILRLPPH